MFVCNNNTYRVYGPNMWSDSWETSINRQAPEPINIICIMGIYARIYSARFLFIFSYNVKSSIIIAFPKKHCTPACPGGCLENGTLFSFLAWWCRRRGCQSHPNAFTSNTKHAKLYLGMYVHVTIFLATLPRQKYNNMRARDATNKILSAESITSSAPNSTLT